MDTATHCDPRNPTATWHDISATSGHGDGPLLLRDVVSDATRLAMLSISAPCLTCIRRSLEPEPVECQVPPKQQRITRERLHCSVLNWSHLREKGGLWLERRVVPAPIPSLCL